MRRRTLLIIALLSIIAASAFSGTDLRTQIMRTTDGLPSNSIRNIYQDSKGFLWLGTLNGLSRYDGNSFLNFQPETSHEQISLTDNRINYIKEDRNGFLWIGTGAELYSCYDLQKSRFVDFTGKGEYGQNYSNFFAASNGDVWLYHKGNGARQIITQNNRTMTSVKFKTERGNLPSNQVQFITEDSSGKIWIGTMHGLAFTDRKGINIIDRKNDFIAYASHEQKMYFLTTEGEIYGYDENSNQLIPLARVPAAIEGVRSNCLFAFKHEWAIFTSTGTYIYNFKSQQITTDAILNIKDGTVLVDNQGDYWIYNHTGTVYYILSETGEMKKFQLIPKDKLNYIDNERYHVIHDSRGLIWISTYCNGLFLYNPSEDKLEHFVSNTKDSPIVSDFLLYIMEDRSGAIWVSSEYSGLSRITVSNEGITRFYPESSELFDRSNTVRMLTRIKDENIWLGTRKGGLYNYDDHLTPRKSKQHFQSNVYAIAKDSKEELWIGTRGDGLKIGDTWYKNIPSDYSSLSYNHIFFIFQDRKDRMWIGTFGGGLDLAEPTADGKYKFRHFLQQKYSQRMIRAMIEDRNGMIWTGTGDGICIFHPDSLIADANNYHVFNNVNGKFCSNEIKCLFRDSKDRIWVGTSGAGLSLCKPTDNYRSLEYEHYGTDDGLVNNTVVAIQEDTFGRLWIATEYGMSKFNPENRSFENYFFSSHTLGNVYNENCSCIGADNKLLFGTNYGLTLIDPMKIPSNEKFSPIVFTNLYINGIRMNPETTDSPLKKQSLSYTDKITLKHFQNSFVLDFSAFDYSDNNQTKYRYWLENYDKEWSAPSSLNFAAYKYLDPGTYTLHVKSCNGAGIWNEDETTLQIIIVPPFWKSKWAMLVYTLLLITILYFAYHIVSNFNNLRNRIKVEKQLTEYKLIFFTNISHEFRTPLTLIQGALEKMLRINNIPRELASPLQTMNRNTQRMLRLINQLLEFRKMQNNKLALSLEETDVIAFLHEIFLSFKDISEQKNMNFRFEPSLPSYKMFIDKGYIDKVTYNLLSNAFKYTPANGTILFSIEVDEARKMLQIQVSDTGVGIPKEKQHELFKRFMQSSFSGDSIGVGLHLTHELVQVHQGTINYRDNENGGSVFTVCIPTDKSVYAEKDFLIPGNVLLKEDEERTRCLTEVSEEVPVPSENVTPLNKRKILIIEDDCEIRQLLKEQIGAYFEVEVAEEGKTGCEKARTYAPDLIVCDVLMPGMSGFEATKKLKSDFATSHIPIILLTALSSPEKQLEGIEAGADAYIAKPFSTKFLLARIFRLIEQREKLREKFSNEPGIIHTAMYSTDRDKEFTERLNTILNANLSRSDFNIEELVQLMKLSRTALYTKVKGVTGYAPIEYLRIIRMKKAAELLLSEERLTVAEVAYKVGINDPFYFSKCFKAQFGISPSVYQKGGKNIDI